MLTSQQNVTEPKAQNQEHRANSTEPRVQCIEPRTQNQHIQNTKYSIHGGHYQAQRDNFGSTINIQNFHNANKII